MAVPPAQALDPFRAIMSAIADPDILVAAATAAGLAFDLNIADADAYSARTRVRALTARIFAAYDALDAEHRLIAAQAALNNLAVRAPDIGDRASDALGLIGWRSDGGRLVVARPDVREIFFPAGSQWDAFVVLQDICRPAANSVMIVDPYCDDSAFRILAACNLAALNVQILCRNYAAAVKAAARIFTAQHRGVTVEVRTSPDFHDRFIVIDGATCVHVGASLNHMGRGAFMVIPVDGAAIRAAVLAYVQASWVAGTVVP